jgi:hypothetical protein
MLGYAKRYIVGIINSDDFYTIQTCCIIIRKELTLVGVDFVLGDLQYVYRRDVLRFYLILIPTTSHSPHGWCEEIDLLS